MASLAKRTGSTKPWQVRFRDHDGRSRSEQFTRKADAEARLREVQAAEETGRLDLLDAGRVTLAQHGAAYVALKRGEWSPATLTQHRYTWNAHVLGSELAGLQLRAIRASHVQGWKVDALDAGVPEGSVRKALGLISQVLDHAALDGIIGANPATPVKRPSGARKGDVLVISPAKVEAIRGSLDGRDAALVSVLAYAGLRPEELRALRWRHVGQRSLRVEFATNPDGTLREIKGQGGQRRSVPLCDALRGDLDAVRDGQPDSAFVFGFTPTRTGRSREGEPWTKADWDNWRKRKFLPAADAAGVEINRPYELRHSIASLWLREGTDPVTVASRLGHSVAVLHATYSHVLADLDPQDKRSVDVLIADARQAP